MKPWDQRKDEPKDAFNAFSRYLSAGSCRHLDQVVSLAVPLYQVIQWSAKHGWPKRAQAYDRWASARSESDPAPEDVKACHDKAFLNFSQVLLLESRKWLSRAQATDMAGEIDIKDCLKMLEYFKPSTKKFEVENKNQDGAGKPKLSDAEFEALESIFSKYDEPRVEH